MSARAARRAAERQRLDLLAAEAYADSIEPTLSGAAWRAAVADFLAGVAFERRRSRLVWRKRAPEWLRLAALIVVAMLATAACWLFVVALAALPV